jgi:hypothetical protein
MLGSVDELHATDNSSNARGNRLTIICPAERYVFTTSRMAISMFRIPTDDDPT